MQRAQNPIRSCNSGEIGPDAIGRIDIKQFYAGMAALKNFEPVPQSGFRLMAGTRRIAKRRGAVSALAVISPVFTLGPHAALATLWQGSIAGAVAAVEFAGLTMTAGSATITVEARNGAGAWTQIGGTFTIAAGETIQRTAARAPGAAFVATDLRIRVSPSVSASFTLAAVRVLTESATPADERLQALTSDTNGKFMLSFTAGIADIHNDVGWCGAAALPSLTQGMITDLDFYAEDDVVGVFHPSTFRPQRLSVFSGGPHVWGVDDWPFDGLPTADLGGVYPKTDDVWSIFVRWAEDIEIFISITVDGETTAGVPLTDLALVAIKPSAAASINYDAWRDSIQTALRDLPSLSSDVVVTRKAPQGSSIEFTVTFGGALSGQEFDLSALIVNTSAASALANHTVIGETEFEPLFSATRGYPGIVDLVQDRLGYGRIPAKTGSIALSATANYYNLNVKAQADTGARADNLRSQITETVLAIKESKYMLVFTDRAAYFANNRTVVRNEPLNFVRVEETGIRPNTDPIDLDGLVYYASANGQQLLSLTYDDVGTNYRANIETILASHLIDGVKRTRRQRAERDQDATRMWVLRDDGRLICAQIIKNQDVTGFCEWRAADGGLVRDIAVDDANRVWLTVQRGNVRTLEVMDGECLFHDAVEANANFASVITGLDYANDTVVWALIEGHVTGPHVVQSGSITIDDGFTGAALVGRWIAPFAETLPTPLVTQNDTVIFRPGRIFAANFNLINTTSIAVGANGEPAENVPLAEASDLADVPTPPKTMLMRVNGLLGRQNGPRLTITQIRPGQCRVRDLSIGAKL